MYIGRPLPLGNVSTGSMPMAWYSVLSTCGTVYGRSFGYSPRALLRADGLAHLQAAAGDQGRHDRRPVVAAGVAAC